MVHVIYADELVLLVLFGFRVLHGGLELIMCVLERVAQNMKTVLSICWTPQNLPDVPFRDGLGISSLFQSCQHQWQP